MSQYINRNYRQTIPFWIDIPVWNILLVDILTSQVLSEAQSFRHQPCLLKLNQYQMTLVVFKTLHDEVMDGGFVQLIYNGYGPFVFFNPFAKAIREWGLDDLASLVNKAGKLFRKYGREIERECSDEEFMALFEKYPDFDDLDDQFVENEEHWVEEIARYIDEHIECFATVVD